VVAGEQVLMLNDVRMRIAQVADLVRSNGWSSLFKEVLFLKRTAIVVEKDLSELTERSKPLTSAKLRLLEIDKEMLSSGLYSFAVNSRYLKALNYLKHGCQNSTMLALRSKGYTKAYGFYWAAGVPRSHVCGAGARASG
jgi:hypothetical protein